MPTITKNASSEPGLSSEKWRVSLGQNVRQLKKGVGAFPTTALLSRLIKTPDFIIADFYQPSGRLAVFAVNFDL